VAIFWNPENPTDQSTLDVTQQAAQDLSPRLDVLSFPVRAAADFVPALQRASDERVDSAAVLAGALIGCCLSDVHEFIERNRIPAIYDGRITGPDVGGLMSYAPSTTGNDRYAATLVDKVLRGANPADLPVQQPSSFEFVINTTAATAIGLTFPASIVAAATEIVQEAARDAHP
jgi:putative ABC transport system substrate-binding protein